MTDTDDLLPASGEAPPDWWPEGYDLPAFRVKRRTYGLMEGGDWVRGSSVETLPHTALRYPSSSEGGATDEASRGLLFVRPFDYHTTEIRWGWPTQYSEEWVEVALVRSSYGHPSTPRDGQTVLRSMRVEFEMAGSVLEDPPIVYDQPLPSGHWYYYSLFFRINPIDWVLGMQGSCVLPRDYTHRDHMWNAVPPYYQWLDANNQGHLQQFLSVFGFTMDNTREFVEGLLNLYNIDRSPMRLLKGLGANFGLPYEAGIGDIRYRGLVANAPNAQHTRGTATGLKQVIEAVSKYEAQVTGSQTLMMYPDDSQFYLSTGNWGGPHPDTTPKLIPLVNPSGGASVRLNGTAGTRIQGPDIAALAGASLLVVEIDCLLDNWAPSGGIALVAQGVAASSNASWQFTRAANGSFAAATYTGGVTASTYPFPVAAITNGTRHKVKFTWTGVAPGSISQTQYAVDGVDASALSTAATFPSGLYNSAANILIGGLSNNTLQMTGNVYGVKIWADNVLVASPDFTGMYTGSTSVTDAQGNLWSFQGAAALADPVPQTLAWDKVYLSRINTLPQQGAGRGVMRVYTAKADETTNLVVLCGDSRIRDDGNVVIVRTDGATIDATHPAPDTVPVAVSTYRDAIPLEAGISVLTGVPYGMSAWLKASEKDVNLQLVMVWVGPTGSPKEVVSVTLGAIVGTGSFGATARDWHQYVLNGKAPAATDTAAAARYMIPGVLVSARVAHTLANRSAGIDVCGVMAYVLGKQDSAVAITPPDRYLTLGDPNEKLGIPKSGFEGYIIGSPKR